MLVHDGRVGGLGADPDPASSAGRRDARGVVPTQRQAGGRTRGHDQPGPQLLGEELICYYKFARSQDPENNIVLTRILYL